MKLIGKASSFGGPDDAGMKNDSGLALYEPHEADLRPDIFLPAPADNPKQETWKRLRTDFPYIALRFELFDDGGKPLTRKGHQTRLWKITNPRTGQWCVGLLVDYGPAESTGRLVDLSPIILTRLRIETDDEVWVEALA